jgi:hypothetical protein
MLIVTNQLCLRFYTPHLMVPLLPLLYACCARVLSHNQHVAGGLIDEAA